MSLVFVNIYFINDFIQTRSFIPQVQLKYKKGQLKAHEPFCSRQL